MPGVITGQQLKEIRRRARLSNQQMADMFGTSLSSVNRMLSKGVRVEDEPTVRERLAPWLPPTEPDRYTTMSDGAILAEMNRMLGIIGQRLADCQTRHEEMEREYRKLLEQVRDARRGSYDASPGKDDDRNNEGGDPPVRPAQAHPAPGPQLL